eukprot:CAMPEP_0176244918 /NCGR_PEP_ID=MMETSP0121_2-20121125/31677_1 /TAXON_ID=160619 /ORGANISM="Kryptoperidinium foliaceum, Strain CCMP 1326" /LENGTH=140 /DNA_ID=CAMNT_0017584537 /DNA_START=342 /DNA_END=764 /DNA_ORIENTATION=+
MSSTESWPFTETIRSPANTSAPAALTAPLASTAAMNMALPASKSFSLTPKGLPSFGTVTVNTLGRRIVSSISVSFSNAFTISSTSEEPLTLMTKSPSQIRSSEGTKMLCSWAAPTTSLRSFSTTKQPNCGLNSTCMPRGS